MLIYYTPFLQRKQGKKAKRLKVFPNLHIIMCSEPSFSVKKYLRGSFLMAFCSFSKDNESAYTIVENKFITHYLPEADGFAVKVYLYGLYLCENRDSDFTVSSMAEILKVEEEKIREAFLFWQDYDLVEILSNEPFTVQYLPVKSAVGRPKKIRYEKYADFNKELQRKLQKVGKFIDASEYIKYMRFLEENPIQPQAFLLVAEYCINKQGQAVTASYIFNKAKKLIRNGCTTYEQVEQALSNYNENEGNIIAVYNAMSIYQRVPDETDYALYAKWTETLGFAKDAILTVAKRIKSKNMNALDATLCELAEKGKLTSKEIESYLTERETLKNLATRIGKKLGAWMQNVELYIDEYVEKWYNYGYEDTSLLDLALYCAKTDRGSFEALDTVVEQLFKEGIVAPEDVKAYLKEKNADLKLFAKIQGICSGAKKSAGNLALLQTWREWNFSDEMILEAAKRASITSNPIPYMNKLLASWKQAGVFEVKDIPSAETKGAGTSSTAKTGTGYGNYTNPSIEAADAKSTRDRYYALRRQRAQSLVDKTLKKANANERFKSITSELAVLEIDIAKAEVRTPEKLPALEERKAALLAERKTILAEMGINESELSPKYECQNCMDTGFLSNGLACTCYKPEP